MSVLCQYDLPWIWLAWHHFFIQEVPRDPPSFESTGSGPARSDESKQPQKVSFYDIHWISYTLHSLSIQCIEVLLIFLSLHDKN